jgi:protein gp37
MQPDWARALRDHCAAAGVPFFFKQWGEWLPCEKGSPIGGVDLLARQGFIAQRVGKKVAGRLLDGVEHNGVPA